MRSRDKKTWPLWQGGLYGEVGTRKHGRCMEVAVMAVCRGSTCILILLALYLLKDFPEKAWEPKVQLPYNAEPGQVPRKIEIERYPVHNFTL